MTRALGGASRRVSPKIHQCVRFGAHKTYRALAYGNQAQMSRLLVADLPATRKRVHHQEESDIAQIFQSYSGMRHH
jgi:hypothetical protein